MRQADEQPFAALVAWASSHSASLHPALDIYNDNVTGFSMRVKTVSSDSQSASLKPGDEILACPLGISLSYLNAHAGGRPLSTTASCPAGTETGFSKFPPDFLSAVAPHVIGRFFLIQQYLLGPSSFWHTYIATLPQPEAPSSWSSPPFWCGDDAAFLEGTNAGIAAETVRGQLKREYGHARTFLKDASFPGWQDYTRPLYDWAYSIFASRSFRPSLVMPPDGAALPEGVAIDDFSVLLPVFDIINHDMQAEVEWLAEKDESASGAGFCKFRSLDTYRPGEQVFNSYGKKTNSELLLSYGFVLPETEELHNDYVHVRTRAASSAHGAAGTTQQQPQDFLVSLRPMNHPSSFLGRARQMVANEAEFDLRPEFSHVEGALVWDLCLMIVGEGGKASFMSATLGDDADLDAAQHDHERKCIRRILSASNELPDMVSQVVEKVKELLLAKLGMEYDKLLSTAPGAGVDEDGNEVVLEVKPENDNQKLALLYRAQAQKVLENAISTLAPGWQDETEEA